MSEATKIQLEGGMEVEIPSVFEYSKCKYCKKEIIWGTTPNGKKIPIQWVMNTRVWITHFDICKKQLTMSQK